MNDFTKEELEDIKNCIWVYDDLRDDSTHAALITKIQLMIDNYKCEHVSDDMIYCSNPPKNRCTKCKEWYR